MKATKFNAIELEVLKALYQETLSCTGGEFGYTGDAYYVGLTKKQYSGYISQLSQKGVFEYHDNSGFDGQFALTQEAIKLAVSL